jgi:drug/metabolite transporter (DMT)-like permease
MLASAPAIIKLLSLAPIVILCWRTLFVAIGLSPFLLKDERHKISFKNAIGILFVALFLLLHLWSWFNGIPKLQVSTATIIYACNPITSAIIGFLVLREKLHLRHAVGILLSIVGIIFTFMSESSETASTEGVIYILFAALFYSSFLVASKKFRTSLGNTTYNFYLNLFTSLLAFIILIVQINVMGMEHEWYGFETREWLVLMLLAGIPSILGHTLIIYAIPHFNINFVSTLKLAGPLVASFYAFLLFGEEFTTRHLVGFFFVASGVLYSLQVTPKKLIGFFKR